MVRGEGHFAMALERRWIGISPAASHGARVVEVNSFGGENKEYQVVIDPQRLQARGLSVREVIEAIEQSSGNAGGGYIEHNREQYVIGTRGLVRSLEDLQTVVIGATQGRRSHHGRADWRSAFLGPSCAVAWGGVDERQRRSRGRCRR